MATGTSGEERDDDATNPVDDALDSTEIDPADDATVPATDAAGTEGDALEADTAKDALAEAASDDAVIATAGVQSTGSTAATAKAAEEKAADKKTADVKQAKNKPVKKAAKPKRDGLFARMGRFFREVRDELKKVVTPTRKELVKYTGVVLSFLIVMMLLVAALDFIFGFGSSWVFGNGTDLFPADTPAATSTVDPAATDPAATDPAATDPAATPDATVEPDATTVPETTTP